MDARFDLLEEIGAGATGRVWRARDRATHLEVALKMINPGEKGLDGLFVREFRQLAHLSHPNLIAMLELRLTDQGPMLVMEYLPEPNLTFLPRETFEEPGALESLVRQLAEVLSFLHEHDIVHGDVKPQNIHFLSSGRVVLLDFGFAAAASTQLPPLGMSPAYAPPEWSPGAVPSPAWDVWGLGAVLHELLVGRPPRPEPVDSIDHPMGPLTLRLLAREPERRPSLAEVISALREGPERPPLLDPLGRRVLARHGLLDRLEETVSRRCELPRILVLHGEAGRGKTTLLRHLAEALRRGGRTEVLTSFGDPFDAMPFSVLDRIAERLAGRADARLRPRISRFFPGAAARIGLEATEDARGEAVDSWARVLAEQLHCLMIDDVDHADAGSGSFLGDVLATMADEGHGVAVCLGQSRESSVFLSALAEAVDASAVLIDTIPVPPLTAAEARLLFGEKTSEIAAGAAEPWLVELTVRLEPAEPTIAGLWSALLEREPRADILCGAIAVAHESVSMADLAEVTEIGLESVSRRVLLLRALGMIVTTLEGDVPRARIIHTRARALVEESLPSGTRVELHRRWAEHLARAEPESTRLARHLTASGQDERACAVWRSLARGYQERRLWTRSAACWERAKACGSLTREETIAHARSLSLTGRGVEAAHTWIRLARTEEDRGRESAFLREAAAALLGAGHGRKGLGVISRVLARSEASVPRTVVGDVLRIRESYRSGDRKLEFELRDGPTAPETQVELEALYAAATGLAMWRPYRSASAQAEFLHRAQRVGDPLHLARALCIHLVQSSGFRYDPKETRRISEVLERVCRAATGTEPELLLATGRAGAAWMEGRTAEHAEWSETAAKLVAGAGDVHPWLVDSIHLIRVHALLESGDLGALRRALRHLVRDAEARQDVYLLSNVKVHAAPPVAWADGRVRFGRRALEEALKPWSGKTMLHLFAWMQAVRSDLAEGKVEAAFRRVRRGERRFRRSLLMMLDSHRSLVADLMACVAGALLGADARPRRWVRFVEEAEERLGDRPHPYCQETAIGLAARRHALAGRRDDAREGWTRLVERAEGRGAHLRALCARTMLEGDAGLHELRRRGVRDPSMLVRAILP